MRRISGLATITTFFVLLAMLLSACGSSSTGGGGTTPTAASSAKVTVGLVTDIGGLNDGGFNQLAYTGYTQAKNQYHFPEKVIQTQSQNDYVKNLTLAAQSANLVIAVGFLMQAPLDQVAKQFPNVKFAIVDGCATNPADKTGACVNLPNVAPLFFKEQQAGCLVGAMAGQMEVDGKSKAPKLLGHNTISAVGGLAIPPVIRYIAGYKYCAKQVDPSVNVVIGYSNNFNDPTKCAAIANKQIADNSADILFQVAGGCGVGVLDAATAHHVYSIGVDVDQSKTTTGTARPSVITSAIKRVDTAAYSIINLAQTGKYNAFVASPTTFDITNDGVGYAPPSSDVPSDAVAKATQFENNMKSASLVVPTAIP